MSFTDEGYTKDTIDEIVSRIIGRLLDTYPTLSLDPSNWIYQLVKVVALENLYQQNIVENAVANMTVMGASGVFLDYHGTENGIFRKSAEYAIGYINPTSTSRIIDTTVNVPEGTIFATSDGLEFVTMEEVGFIYEIPMTHTSGGIGSQDIIPRFYIDFTVDQILTTGDVEITATYVITDQILEWTEDPGLAPGVSYKIKPDNTASYTLSIYSRSNDIGTDGNAGIGTIIVNTESAQWVNSVTNLAAFTGGVDDESDVDFRYRIFQSRRRHFTFDNIRDMVNNLDGVDDCRVYQTVVSDVVLQDPWDPQESTTVELDNSGLSANEYDMFIVNFIPSQFIGTMKGFTLHTKCTKTVKVPDLYVYFVQHGEGGFSRPEETHLSDRIVDYGDMIGAGLDTWTSLFVTLPYNGLDYSNTYRIYLYSPTADATNYWSFDTNTDNTGIDDSWRTIHKKITMIAEAAAEPLYTGAAAVPAGTYNGTGDSIIKVKVATIDPSNSTGTVIIDGDSYEYTAFDTGTTDTEFTLSGTLTKDYLEDDVVTTTNIIYNTTGNSRVKTKVAPVGLQEPGLLIIDGDQYTYDDVTDTYYFNLTSGVTLTSDYLEDDVVTFPGTESALGAADEVITLKTFFGANAYTISVIPKTGYSFEDTLKSQIETLVNYEDGGGYSPVCVQVNVVECEQLEMDINSAILSIEEGYVFDNVVETVKTNISNYLAGLHPGDDVIYSQVEKAILISAGIYRVRELEIEIDGETADNFTEYDLGVGDNNYVTLGTSLSFTEE